MDLTKVTITGADDSVKPEQLIELSLEFPFVEWAILLSASQEGGKRFPSRNWMVRFSDAIHDEEVEGEILTAGHLCGKWLRQLLKGEIVCPHFELNIFDRIQLNFHGETHNVSDAGFFLALNRLRSSGREFIFQWDGVNNYILDNAIANGIPGQALFDLSHGAGIAPAEWPEPLPHIACGYAGGLGPDNLEREIKMIAEKTGDKPFWIDMETKVRSNDDSLFDLGKVRACLAIAKEAMAADTDSKLLNEFSTVTTLTTPGLNECCSREVENIMDLPLSWLMTWDVVDDCKNADPIEVRNAARHKLKDAVTELALKAQNALSSNSPKEKETKSAVEEIKEIRDSLLVSVCYGGTDLDPIVIEAALQLAKTINSDPGDITQKQLTFLVEQYGKKGTINLLKEKGWL